MANPIGDQLLLSVRARYGARRLARALIFANTAHTSLVRRAYEGATAWAARRFYCVTEVATVRARTTTD